jgi:hypothetical protein
VFSKILRFWFFFLALRFRVLQVGLGDGSEEDEIAHTMAGLALAIQLLEKSSSGLSYLFQIVAFFFHFFCCFTLQYDTLMDKGFSIVKVVNFRFSYKEQAFL